MFYLNKLSLGRQVSLAICVMDDFTGEPVKDKSVQISIADQLAKPVYKPDGFFVFTGLSAGQYTLLVDSDKYFNRKIRADLEQFDRPLVSYISMKPLPAYSFNNGNLIRFSVVDSNNKPIAGARVNVLILSKKGYKAKLGKQGVIPGDSQFFANNLTGKISVPDCFIITDPNDEARFEEFEIADKLPEDKCFKIRGYFQNKFERGTPIWPLLKTWTDFKGEAVVYLRQMPINKVDALITITYQNFKHSVEACFVEGASMNLGSFKLNINI